VEVKLTPLGLYVLDYSEDELSYSFIVNSARKYLRKRDFLHYASQFVPCRIGSETWSLAWAYIREVDDVIDSPLNAFKRLEIIEKEWEIVEDIRRNTFVEKPPLPFRYFWLNQFIENIELYYSSSERQKIWSTVHGLYESAVLDAKRYMKVVPRKLMYKLLEKKAVCFFRLYFLVGKLNLEKYLDDIAECLGLALGMLDDILDILYDWRSGYINITAEDLEEIGLKYDPRDRNFIEKILEKKVIHKKSLEILKLLFKARALAWKLRDNIVKKLVLRLTEVFAAPILEGRFLPGEKYFFKGGHLLLKILPENEEAAYEIGHRFISFILSVPQISPLLIKTWIRLIEKY